ncbi:MAG: PLP-dependent cysteine synthase family protein [Oligoflexales bacterium]
MLSKSAIYAIGKTPLIKLDRIYSGPGELYGKAEFLQPGGSVKDRAALQIIKDAYESGGLCSGQPVVEMTSGNMGAGLAVVCAALGNPFIAVMSEGNSPERAKMLRGLGAELVLVPQVDGMPNKVTGNDIQRATEVAMELVKVRSAFYADQFHNQSCVKAHLQTTGPEIWSDMDGKVDAFVAAIGSGGTFVGASRYLKNQKKDIYLVAVEPQGAEVLSGKPVYKPQHIMQGIGYGFIPPHWDRSLPNDIMAVTDEESGHFKEMLGKKEGLFVGFSAGANVAASVRLLTSGKLPRNASVVTLLCDSGLKY